MIGSETVVLVGAPATDIHGDPIPGSAVERVVEGCSVAPVRTEEDTNRAATVTGRATALLPTADAAGEPLDETQIKADMRLRWRGREYDVAGNAMPWVFLDGDVAGIEVPLSYGEN